MYAVIEDSGQQFRVGQGDVLDVDLRDLPEDAEQVEFDRVLLVSSDEGTQVGTPVLKGAKVVADIVDAQIKGKKVYVHRWRRRKNSRTRTGHRQKFLRVRISEIQA